MRIDNIKSEAFEEKLVVDHASDSFKNVNNEPLSKALKSKNYIMNLLMGMLESFFFYTIYNVCKPFGLIQMIDEKLLFILVNIFAFLNGSSRMVFGYLYDKLGFKILYRIFLIFEVTFLLFRYLPLHQFTSYHKVQHSILLYAVFQPYVWEEDLLFFLLTW